MKLDLGKKTAHVKPVDVKYYTSIREHTDIYVVGGAAAYPSPEVSMRLSGTSQSADEIFSELIHDKETPIYKPYIILGL